MTTSRDAAIEAIASLLQRQPDASARELAEEGARLHPEFTSRLLSMKVRDLIAGKRLTPAGERRCTFTGQTVNIYRAP